MLTDYTASHSFLDFTFKRFMFSLFPFAWLTSMPSFLFSASLP